MRHAERLRRYARLHSCFVADLGDGITSRVLEDKIFEREDVIIWSWRLSNFRNVAVPEILKACKLSATIIWLASENKLNNPHHDFKASPTPNRWAKAESFKADSIVAQFGKK